MKKFNEFVNEGSETTQVVGSGTKVGGGAVGKFTTSAGQSVSGGDSESSFSKNSNSSKSDITRQDKPHYEFKEKVKRKKKKDKTERPYNKKGENIDKQLYKKKNENMIKKWEEFSKLNEGYLSIGNAVKIRPDHEDGSRIGIILDRDGDFLTVDLGTHKITINASSIFDLNADK